MSNEKPQAEASLESIPERVILWQDHAYPYGYRATLSLLHFADGSEALELSHGGYVIRRPYTFPFLEKDRL